MQTVVKTIDRSPQMDKKAPLLMTTATQLPECGKDESVPTWNLHPHVPVSMTQIFIPQEVEVTGTENGFCIFWLVIGCQICSNSFLSFTSSHMTSADLKFCGKVKNHCEENGGSERRF
ncbi:hypothetical protein STEG23_020152 [Scotinomys teguina]